MLLVMNESEAYTCELQPAIAGVNRISVVAEVSGNPPSGSRKFPTAPGPKSPSKM